METKKKNLLLVGGILIAVTIVGIAAILYFLREPIGDILGGGGVIDPVNFRSIQDDFVVRPEDLPDEFHIVAGSELPWTNKSIVLEMGEVQGKTYISETGRVDGWQMRLKRTDRTDIAPAVVESTIEIFETKDGARLALSEDWFKAYQDEDRDPDFISGGCNLGDECILYSYTDYDPATQLTYVRYEIAFVYENVLVWIGTDGLDIDHDESYLLDAAQVILDRLEELELDSSS